MCALAMQPVNMQREHSGIRKVPKNSHGQGTAGGKKKAEEERGDLVVHGEGHTECEKGGA